jgi:hypothetical protein
MMYRFLLIALFLLISPAAFAQDITTGLIGHWKLDETSGTSVIDYASNNNGTMQGGLDASADSVDGRVGTALDFDGVDDLISFPIAPSHQIVGDMTASVWFKADTLEIDDPIITHGASGETEPVNILYVLRMDGTNANDLSYTHEYGAGNNENYTYDTNLVVGKWYHAAIVRDISTNTVDLYLDGTLFETFNYSNDPTGGQNSSSLIGQNISANKEFDGAIDDVRVYNRASALTRIIKCLNIIMAMNGWHRVPKNQPQPGW